MKEVSVYIDTSIAGRWVKDGYVGYCLEYYPEGKNRPTTRYGYAWVEKMNENRAQLEALIRGMTRMREKCVLSVYTESEYLYMGAAGGGMEKWKQNGWKTAKGAEIKNRDKWEALDRMLRGNLLQFFLREHNAYRQQLKDDLRQLSEGRITAEALERKRNGRAKNV